MKEYKPFKSGKVRELYDLGDSLVMVCTDRISAFDNILKCPIPEKGCVLNRMSKFWFDLTKDIVPNHMISIDTKDMPEFFQTAEFEGRSMKTQKLDMIPVATVAIDGTKNAAFLAVEIGAVSDPDLFRKYKAYREKAAKEIFEKDAKLQKELGR